MAAFEATYFFDTCHKMCDVLDREKIKKTSKKFAVIKKSSTFASPER